MMKWSGFRWALLPGVLVAAACFRSAESSRTAETSDSAGITIIVNGDPAWRGDEVWSLSSEPELTVGALDGPEEQQLVSVVAAARQSDGDVVVVDRGAGTVRLYDHGGEFVRTLGGPGEGPGEFRDPQAALVTTADTMVVWDGLAFRLSTFDESGALAATRTLDLARIGKAVEPPLYPGKVTPLPDGSFLVRLVEKGKDVPSGTFRPRSGALRVSGDLSSVDTLMFFGDVEQTLVEAPFGQYPLTLPEARETWITFGGNPVTICIGPQEAPEIDCFPGLGPRRKLRWEWDPSPLTRAEIADWRLSNLHLFDLKLTEDQVLEMLDQVPVPAVRPAYSRIILDKAGNLWVRLGPVGGGAHASIEFLVFDPDGYLKGPVQLPSMRVLEIGDDYVMGIRQDELGVEYLEVYGILKPERER